jgi:hypothetical protein
MDEEREQALGKLAKDERTLGEGLEAEVKEDRTRPRAKAGHGNGLGGGSGLVLEGDRGARKRLRPLCDLRLTGVRLRQEGDDPARGSRRRGAK